MCHKVNKQLLETTANPVVPEDHEDHDIIDIQESWDMDNDGEDDLGLYSFGELIEDPVEVLDIIAMDDDTEELTPDNSSDLKCPVCKSWIPESTHLRHHLKEHYSNEVMFICSQIVFLRHLQLNQRLHRTPNVPSVQRSSPVAPRYILMSLQFTCRATLNRV